MTSLKAADLQALKERARRNDLQALREMAALKREDAIAALAEYAYLTVWKGEDEKYPGVSQEAIRLLVQIPGHAEACARQIEEARMLSEYQYDLRRMKKFELLGVLKSEETIQVLGRYLSDRRDENAPDPLHPLDWEPRSSNALLAARALAKLGLPDAPMQKPWGRITKKDIPLWQAWWAARQQRKDSASERALPGDRGTAQAAGGVASRETKPASAPSPRVDDSAWPSWLGWLAVAVGAIGLLWLTLKRQS